MQARHQQNNPSGDAAKVEARPVDVRDAGRLVHLDVEDQVEELLRQLSYAIKNQLVASKAPY